ncbi:unnamed protein product [Porites lobata]|uniref:Uncharacterized protein n=1 Tax=Porites lobata TaxID=104759 RepID=A0ABN8P9Y8_9CNID|nr:unnamed protein product [Porites lobata]
MNKSKTCREILLLSHADNNISDAEFVPLYDCYRSKNRDFGYQSYDVFDLEIMNSADCKPELRVEKADLPRLADALHISAVFHCKQRSICDGFEGLCVLLRRTSYPCRFSDMIQHFPSKFQFVSLHPRPYGANTLFHGMYCLCFIKGVVWVKGKVKLGIVSECVCVGQVVVFRERPGRDSPSLVNTAAWSDINRSTVGSSSTSVSYLRLITYLIAFSQHSKMQYSFVAAEASKLLSFAVDFPVRVVLHVTPVV